MRHANIFYKDQKAGLLTETEDGYEFAICLNICLQQKLKALV